MHCNTLGGFNKVWKFKVKKNISLKKIFKKCNFRGTIVTFTKMAIIPKITAAIRNFLDEM